MRPPAPHGLKHGRCFLFTLLLFYKNYAQALHAFLFPTRAGLASPHALACALAVAPRPLRHCWPPELSIVGEGFLPPSLPCFAMRLMLIEFPCFRSPSSSRTSAARGARAPVPAGARRRRRIFLAAASSSLVNTFNASSRGEHQHPG
jgi:hypothetical protein